MNILKHDPTYNLIWSRFFKALAITIGCIVGITLIVLSIKGIIHTTEKDHIKERVKNYTYNNFRINYPNSNCLSIDNVIILDTVYKRTVFYKEISNYKDSLRITGIYDYNKLIYNNLKLISLTNKNDIAWIDVMLFYHIKDPTNSIFNKIKLKYIPLDNFDCDYEINNSNKIQIK